jgi:flagellar biosynthesis chaperone FliJ
MKSKRFSWVNSMFFRQLSFYPMICFIAVFLCAPASAEFYRYVDEHGNVMFTDDLSKVPTDQREKVKPYEESITKAPPVETKKDENAAAVKDDVNEFKKEQQRLQNQEKVLNQEYKDLMKMRSQLNEKKSAAVTDAQVKEYNQQIIEFNERIQNYEKARDALAAEVDAFNARVEENSNKGENQ